MAAVHAHSGTKIEAPAAHRRRPRRWEWLGPVLARIAALDGNVTAWRQLPMQDILLHVG